MPTLIAIMAAERKYSYNHLTITLPPTTLRRGKKLARSLGLPYSTLIAQLVEAACVRHDAGAKTTAGVLEGDPS